MTLIQSIHMVSKEELQYATFANKCENHSLKLVNSVSGQLATTDDRNGLQEVKKVVGVQLVGMCFVQ